MPRGAVHWARRVADGKSACGKYTRRGLADRNMNAVLGFVTCSACQAKAYQPTNDLTREDERALWQEVVRLQGELLRAKSGAGLFGDRAGNDLQRAKDALIRAGLL